MNIYEFISTKLATGPGVAVTFMVAFIIIYVWYFFEDKRRRP